MKRSLIYFLCALTGACSAPIDTTPCASLQSVFSAPEGWHIFGTKHDQAVLFRGGFTVKADGAPHAYHFDDGRGLAKLAHAGHVGNWWGLVTDTGKRSGKPVVQGRDDPAPGYFVSPTGLFDPVYEKSDPRRYIDAAKIPYITLPSNSIRTQEFWRARGITYGDFAMIYDARRDRLRGAIFADAGPDNALGQGSRHLAEQFELETGPRSAKVHDQRFIYLLFPRSGDGSRKTTKEIKQHTDDLFLEWGGKNRINACADLIMNL